jgi:hypothetical protein
MRTRIRNRESTRFEIFTFILKTFQDRVVSGFCFHSPAAELKRVLPEVSVSTLAIFVVCVSIFGMVAGCDDPLIDPFVEGKHFTVYGYLNAFDNEHFVRVVAVRRSPESIPTTGSPHAELDGVVTTTDLTTGVEQRWVHTLRKLDDGNYGHLFTAAFVVRKGHEYEMVVTRSDGATTVARTRVPNLKQMEVEPAVVVGDSTFQTITWVGASTPERIVVNYCAKRVEVFRCEPVNIDYGRSGRRTEDGWAVDILLSKDLAVLRQQMGVEDSVQLELAPLDLLFTVLDDQWVLPEGSFDPEEFAQPDALTNVENGFGFWGSMSRSTGTWMPEADALAVSGYVPSDGSGAR